MTSDLQNCVVPEFLKFGHQFSARSNFVSEKFRDVTFSSTVNKNENSGTMQFMVKKSNRNNLVPEINEASNSKLLSGVGCGISTASNKRKYDDVQDEEDPLICYKCHKSFPSRGEVVMHLKLFHNACAYRDCSKISDFKMHSTVCSNRGFGCAVCNMKFTEKSLLLMHFNQHINAAFYVCDICRAGFQQRKHLQKHVLEVHHKNVTLPVTPSRSKAVYQKCDRCSKYFQLLSEFEEHRSQCDSKLHSCEFCGIVFSTAYRLESHKCSEHNHSAKGYFAFISGKRYFCGTCYMGYFNADALKEHLKSHIQVNDHVCDECQSSFCSDDDLQEHYLQHIEEHYVLQDVIKQHSCSSCELTFKTLDQLKSHLDHDSCKKNFMKTKDNDSSLNDNQKKSILGSCNMNIYDEKCDKENSDINSAANIVKDAIETSNQSRKSIQSDETTTNCDNFVIAASADNENMDFEQNDVNNSQNTVQYEILNPEFDISNVPVYALKDGDELLNCDDNQCVVVIDLKSYFVLQRGVCASESRMPDVQNTEPYDENDVINAEFLQNHMQQILLPPVENLEKMAESIEKRIITDQGLKSANLDVSNCVNDCNALETEVDYLEATLLQQGSNICDNQNSEIVISDKNCSLAIPENSVPYFNGEVKHKSNVPKEQCVDFHNPFSASVPRVCNICQQVFGTSTSLYLHMKGSHTGFDCYRCGQSYSSEVELFGHEVAAHQNVFLCDLCDVVFTKEYLLNKHKRNTHGGKFFICDICGKSYVLRKEYEIHLMIHKDETPSTKCDICGKVYGSIRHYMRHRATHEGASPPKKHICNVCNKAFQSSNPLKKHITTHFRKTASSYECPKCKLYFSPKDLTKHVDFHDAVSY